MHELLIHIGFHKTGTSWLQENVFASGSSVFEPLGRKTSGQSDLIRAVIADPEGYLPNPFDTNDQFIRARVQRILEMKSDRIQDKLLVLSNERLSGYHPAGGFDAAAVAMRLCRAFPEAKILIGIREQKSWILSSYFQYLSEGGRQSLHDFLNTPYDSRRPFFSPNHVKYHFLIRAYRKMFGPEKVLVLPYELFRADKEEYLGRLGEFVGRDLTVSPDRFENYSNRRQHYYTDYHLRWLNVFLHRSSVTG